MPFSYLYVSTESNDGKVHNIRLYSDITGGNSLSCLVVICLTPFAEFLQDSTSTVNISWASKDDGTNIILSEQLVEPFAFTEIDNRAADATEYYCYKRASFIFIRYIHGAHLKSNDQINGTTTSWQISSSDTSRTLATNMNTSLNNTADSGQAPLSE